MGDQNVHGWIAAAPLREMSRLEGHATFEKVLSKFKFARSISQGSVEAPTLWLKHAMQILWNVEKERTRKTWEVHSETCQCGQHQICSIMWADNFSVLSHSKMHLEQMMREVVEEAGRWNLEPKPTSLWWTSKAEDMVTMNKRTHKFPFE